MSEIIVERHEGWAEIVFNRPERRNAIDLAFAQQFLAALEGLNGDENLRAVVLSGAGGFYCSGLDLKAFVPPPPWREEFNVIWRGVHTALIDSPKALIVALQGGAINGGAALAFAGDLVVAGRSSFIQVGELQLGMPIPYNTSWLVLKHGEAAALRFCMMADRVGAEDLLRLGIATEIVEEAAAPARAREIAARIAGWPAAPLGVAKRGVRATARRMSAADFFELAAAPAALRNFAPQKVS
ncbi:MAG: enoyl-CoA hydratase/isomerase family protein [Hyphomicrobiales bacterium]|nr:enoyl-CoA hydratase/isomerase family protein [Hyphomicrobiales bacterium]